MSTKKPAVVEPSKGLSLAGCSLKAAVDVGVGMQDIVAVVSAKKERELRGECQEADALLKKLITAESEAAKALIEAVDAQAQTEGKVKAATLARAIEAFGLKGESSVTGQLLCQQGKADRLLVSMRVTVHGCPSTSGYNSSSNTVISRGFEVAPNANLRKAKGESEAASKAVADQEDVVLNLRRRLANLPSMERQARAEITRTALNSSQDGKQILEAIDGVSEVPLLSN